MFRAGRVLVVAVVLLAAYAVWLVAVPVEEATRTAVADAVITASAASGAVACAFRARRGSGRQAAGWVLLAAGMAAWTLGEVVWTTYEVVLAREVPSPSAADLAYLAWAPLVAAGLLLVPKRLGDPTARARVLLDGLVVAGALLLVGWLVAIGPAYRAADGESPLAKAVLVAYPALDVVVAVVAVYAAMRLPVRTSPREWMLVGGLLGFVVSDVGWLFLELRGTYYSGHPIDLGWVLCGVLVAAAATSRHDASAVRAPATPLGTYLPFVIAGPTFAAFMALAARGLADAVAQAVFMGLVVLVLARQFVAIQENRRLAKGLGESLARLEESERIRTQLLNNVAHDLATPLSVIDMQLFLGDDAPPDARRMAVIQRNMTQLRTLVNDLKDLARLQAGRLRLDPRPLDLDAAVRASVESFAEMAKRAGVRLVGDGGTGGVVEADPQRLQQVLGNLVGNAIKFTPSGGEVRVSVERAPGGFRVAVADTGRGLAPEEIAALFRPFSQMHERAGMADKGTGLGLYISKGIVEGHGGRIGCESGGLGRGATFAFVLPEADARVRAGPVPRVPAGAEPA